MIWKSTTRLSTMVLIAVMSTALIAVGPSGAQAQPADPNIVVTLAGTGVPVVVNIPNVATPGACFQTNLFNTHTGALVGTGIDCIDIVGVDLAGTSFSVNRTTIFQFPQGQLVANGLTTVVLKFGASSPAFTHVVGDADPATPNIIFGTGRFRNATGNVRLSGIVDLSSFPGTVGFNCIFVIDLD